MLTLPKELLDPFHPPELENSYFISFEGIEGSGKSTQIQSFAQELERQGYTVHCLREPGGTSFGEKLRQAMLGSDVKIHPLAEAMLFMSARTQILSEKVLPALEQEKTVVILDRYIDSTIVYQGIAGQLGLEQVLKHHATAPLNLVPNITFYLDIPLEVSLERQKLRGQEKDYFESQDHNFYQKLIDGYRMVAHNFPRRVKRVDATKSIVAVAKDINQQWKDFQQCKEQ
jgi:dTMP kinase